jgi:FkbM family methyltransferase
MFGVDLSRQFGNGLYKLAFPVYRPIYRAFKAYVDRRERRLLRRHLTAGCVVVDGGANIGIYSEFFAKCVRPDGVVHSFEPSPENFGRLRSSLAKFQNVRLNQLALDDETKESLLYLSENLNVDHRAYPTEGELRQTIVINTIRLDEYFRPGERVDLIKIDIQGYELHALRGAKRVLTDNMDIKLLIELWPYGLRHAGTSADALVAFLADQEFTLSVFEGDNLTEFGASLLSHDSTTSYLNLFAQRAAR